MLLLIIYVSFVSLGLPDAVLGAAWPMMYGELSAGVGWAGPINMLISLGTIVSSLMTARLVARMGTARLVLYSVMVTALMLFFFGLAPGYWALIALALPLGLGAGAVDAALNSYVSLHYQARQMNWLHCFWGLGASVGPLIVSLSAGAGGGWRGGYLSIGIVQGLFVTVLWRSLPLWQKDAAADTGSRKQPAPWAMLKLPGVPYALAAFFFYCSVEWLAGLWAASYLALSRGVARETAAAFSAFFFAGIMAGRLLSGFLSARYTFRAIMSAGGLFLLGGWVSLFALPARMGAAALFLIGFGCAPFYPMLIHRTPHNFGEKDAPSIISLQMATAYTGTLLVPPLFGALTGETYLYLLPFTALLLSALLCLCVFLSEKKARRPV